MVLAICRRILIQEADVEDAFQSTFLELARQSGSIRNRAIVAIWLNEVAYRTATKLLVETIRRRSLESKSVKMWPTEFVVPDNQHQDAARNELRPVLHDEVRRLPAKYRIPVILSYLEGNTNEEVAALLRWPIGTVKGRLSRARSLLRSRLARRGISLSAAFLLTVLADGKVFAEVVPPELIKRTLLYVQEASLRSASADSSPNSPQRRTQSRVQGATDLRALSIFQQPRFVFILLAILSLSTAIGMATAIKPSAISEFVGSIFPAHGSGKSAGTSCH
jgi:RNA polymerase sigma factor (sigma-70 family)